MSRDEAKKILGEGATEEQITNFLNNYHLNENSKIKELEKQLNDLKNENTKYSDYDSIKSQLDEINKSKMTEQEKLEADKKATMEALRQAKIIYNTAKVKEILAGETIDEKLISNLVTDNEETSIANANSLKATLNSLKESVEKKTKETLVNVDLKPSISNVNQNDDAMNIDKFMDLSAEEQEKFISEHPEEYKNL